MHTSFLTIAFLLHTPKTQLVSILKSLNAQMGRSPLGIKTHKGKLTNFTSLSSEELAYRIDSSISEIQRLDELLPYPSTQYKSLEPWRWHKQTQDVKEQLQKSTTSARKLPINFFSSRQFSLRDAFADTGRSFHKTGDVVEDAVQTLASLTGAYETHGHNAIATLESADRKSLIAIRLLEAKACPGNLDVPVVFLRLDLLVQESIISAFLGDGSSGVNWLAQVERQGVHKSPRHIQILCSPEEQQFLLRLLIQNSKRLPRGWHSMFEAKPSTSPAPEAEATFIPSFIVPLTPACRVSERPPLLTPLISTSRVCAACTMNNHCSASETCQKQYSAEYLGQPLDTRIRTADSVEFDCWVRLDTDTTISTTSGTYRAAIKKAETFKETYESGVTGSGRVTGLYWKRKGERESNIAANMKALTAKMERRKTGQLFIVKVGLPITYKYFPLWLVKRFDPHTDTTKQIMPILLQDIDGSFTVWCLKKYDRKAWETLRELALEKGSRSEGGKLLHLYLYARHNMQHGGSVEVLTGVLPRQDRKWKV